MCFTLHAAVAVGRELFEPQSKEFAEILLQIQRWYLVHCMKWAHVLIVRCHIEGLEQSDDEITPQYLMSTWAKVCQALGSNFEPYLQQVMPLVFHSAAVRADMSVIGMHVQCSATSFSLSLHMMSQIQRSSLHRRKKALKSSRCKASASRSRPHHWTRNARPLMCSSLCVESWGRASRPIFRLPSTSLYRHSSSYSMMALERLLLCTSFRSFAAISR